MTWDRFACGVAIIRRGGLFTVERVETLREKAGQRVIVRFVKPVTKEDWRVFRSASGDKAAQVFVSAPAAVWSAYRSLSRHTVLHLHAEEHPLEEVFLKFFDGQERRHRRQQARTERRYSWLLHLGSVDYRETTERGMAGSESQNKLKEMKQRSCCIRWAEEILWSFFRLFGVFRI